jgi:outer membrane protein assembly factor BamB
MMYIFLLGVVSTFAVIPQPVEQAMEQVKPAGGWAVCVGTTDGAIEVALARDGRWVVTGLVYDPAAGEKARDAAALAGVAGRAAFHDVIDSSRLPIVDSSVALLVVDADAMDGKLPTEDEVQRVLRPGGIAVILRDDVGETASKNRPADIDDWTHFNYDATASDASRDERAGPIKSLRWLGGDPFHDDIVGMRSVAGVYVSIENNEFGRTSVHPPEGTIVARDAFSGVVLWSRPGFYVRSRYSFLVDEERVYLHGIDRRRYQAPESWKEPRLPNVMPMIALDLRTGQEVVMYDEGLTARTTPPPDRTTPTTEKAELVQALLVEAQLIQKYRSQIVALEPATGRRMWEQTAEDNERFGFVAADDGKLVAARGESYHRNKMGYLQNTPIFTTRAFVCFDLATGRELWSSRPVVLDEFPHNIRVACKDGVVAMIGYDQYHNTQLNPVMTVIDLATGEQLWSTDEIRGVISGGHYPRPQIHHGKVWATGAGGGAGFDLRTGENRVERYSQNFRCSMNRATPNWLISSQKFTSIETGKSFYTEATRGRCDFGLFPANGMVYGSIGSQCGCATFVRPTAAFATERLPAGPWSGERLLKGAAGAGKSGRYALDDKAWPMFLHDGRHSSWTDVSIDDTPSATWKIKPLGNLDQANDSIRQEWAVHQQIPGPVTPPTVFDGTLCVAFSHQQSVLALDPATGETLWQAHLDGRIDTPPTLAEGCAFVGTRTGWVYALDRATGHVRWRFLAAPHQQLLIAHGQAESAWPVFGSVLLHDGLIWAAAGRQAELDHGIYWYGLDPATGEVRKSGRIAETADWHEKFWDERTRATNQPLSTDGERIVLWRSGIDPDTGQQVRFGSTVKQVGGPDRAAFCLLGSAKWGKMRVSSGAGYAGFGGKLFAFDGTNVIGVVGSIHQSVERFTFNRENAIRKENNRERLDKRALWTYRKNIPRGLDENALLVHAGGTVVLGKNDGLYFLDAETGEENHAIKEAVPTLHGAAISDGRVFITLRNGSLMCLE